MTKENSTTFITVKIKKRTEGTPNRLGVPQEIPVTLAVARHAMYNRDEHGKRMPLCMFCLSKGIEKKATCIEIHACDNPVHIRYMRQVTRWARTLAVDATS